MVIVKLYGDEWGLEEKIVASLKPASTFASVLALITSKLGAESFNGLCLYRTEGRPPGAIRPTVPISINSTPQREKMVDGTIVYVKVADLQQQEMDVLFQESLDNFRRDRDINGIQPDGSDVVGFKSWLASNLNMKEAGEIAEHEQTLRSKVEVEEFRGFRNITVDERDKMKLKDEELDGRTSCSALAFAEAQRLFAVIVCGPLRKERLLQLNREETMARLVLERDLISGELQELATEERAERRSVQRVIDARQAQERKAEAARQKAEAERQARERAEAEEKRREELEAKERERQMLEELRKQQQGWADPEKVQQMVDEAVASSSREMTTRVAREVEKVSAGLRTYVESQMRASQHRFDELLAYLLPFRNAALSASFGTQLTHNQALVNLYEEHVKELGKQIDKRVESVHAAVEVHKKAEAAAEVDCKRLLVEQKKLLVEFAAKEQEEQDMRDLEERMLTAEQRRTMDVLYAGILKSHTLLDAFALEHQRRQVLDSSKDMATAHNYRRLLAERVAEMVRAAHPNARLLDRFLYGGAIPLDRAQRGSAQRLQHEEQQLAQLPYQEREARLLERELVDAHINAQHVDIEAQAIIFVYAERHGLPAEEVAALLDKYQCAWRVADELLLRVGTVTSNQFDFARKYVEEYSPNLRPVLDLLLDVYRGREVELVAAIYTSCQQQNSIATEKKGDEEQQSSSDFDWSRADNYVEGKEGEMPLERSFYYHKHLRRSQWLAPRCWERGSGDSVVEESSIVSDL